MTTQLSKKEDLQAAVYGLTRLVAGYHDWVTVHEVPDEDRLRTLFNRASEAFHKDAELHEHTNLLRKMRAYSQLLQLQRFCFDEVEWEDE